MHQFVTTHEVVCVPNCSNDFAGELTSTKASAQLALCWAGAKQFHWNLLSAKSILVVATLRKIRPSVEMNLAKMQNAFGQNAFSKIQIKGGPWKLYIVECTMCTMLPKCARPYSIQRNHLEQFEKSRNATSDSVAHFDGQKWTRMPADHLSKTQIYIQSDSRFFIIFDYYFPIFQQVERFY